MTQRLNSPGLALWIAVPCILFLTSLAASPAAHATETADNTQSNSPAARVPGEVLVRFTSGSTGIERQDSLDAAGVDGSEPITGIPRARRVALEDGQTINDALDELRSRDDVAWAQPNILGHISATPNDPEFGQLWADHNTGQDVDGLSGTADADIDATDAWNTTTGTADTKVAVVDTGIDPDNPDIAPNIDESLSRNFAASITTGDVDSSDWQDQNGHGTHVAGTIAASGDNGVGVAGINWKTDLIAVRACDFDGYCDAASVASALAYAGQVGARAVNVSLGFNGTPQDASAMKSAIAAYPNTLYSVAAGNEQTDNDSSDIANDQTYPCDVDLANVVCVAATDQNDGLADYSNYGSTSVDLAAPGDNVLSTVPNIVDRLDPDLSSGLSGWDQSPSSSWSMTTTPGGHQAIKYTGSGSTSSVTTPTLDFSEGDRCSSIYYLKATLHSGQSFSEQVSVDNGATWETPGPYGDIDSSSDLDPSSFTDLDSWLGDIADGEAHVKIRFRIKYAAGASSTAPAVQVALPSATCINPQPEGGTYDYYSGTSMATPQVTGAATLLFADKPSLDAAGVREAILSSVDPLDSLSGKTVTGGRLNLAAAVAYESGTDPVVDPSATSAASFRVLGVRRTASGRAIIRARVSGAGVVRLFPTRSVVGGGRKVSKAGIVRLGVQVRGPAQKRLRRGGRTRVVVKLGFSPSSGSLIQRHRTLTLVKRR